MNPLMFKVAFAINIFKSVEKVKKKRTKLTFSQFSFWFIFLKLEDDLIVYSTVSLDLEVPRGSFLHSCKGLY